MISIAAVFITESVNSAVERLCDLVMPQYSRQVKEIKDLAAGAVLMNMETNEILIARAKTVIIATGGAGRMHYQGFPTSNHYGATARYPSLKRPALTAARIFP